MNIAVFDLEDWERESFERLADDHELTLLAEPLSPENAGQHSDAEVVSGFVYSSFSNQVMEQLSSLKLIATRSTGFDHIPLEVCRERGIDLFHRK